jgi:hypothetical protein
VVTPRSRNQPFITYSSRVPDRGPTFIPTTGRTGPAPGRSAWNIVPAQRTFPDVCERPFEAGGQPPPRREGRRGAASAAVRVASPTSFHPDRSRRHGDQCGSASDGTDALRAPGHNRKIVGSWVRGLGRGKGTRAGQRTAASPLPPDSGSSPSTDVALPAGGRDPNSPTRTPPTRARRGVDRARVAHRDPPQRPARPAAYVTDHHSGGPRVMRPGTPYEHLHIPVR